MSRAPTESTGGSVAADIANVAVRLLREYTGRGPTKARAYMGDDVVTVVLRDTLTKGELALVQDGQSELVLSMRKAFQRAMREELVAAIEGLLDRRVAAFLSDNHIDPDVAVECFVLAPRGHDPDAQDRSGSRKAPGRS